MILQSDSILVTVSIGGFVAKNGSLDTELLAAADAALYEAKRNGRNQVVISTDSIVSGPENTVNNEISAG